MEIFIIRPDNTLEKGSIGFAKRVAQTDVNNNQFYFCWEKCDRKSCPAYKLYNQD